MAALAEMKRVLRSGGLIGVRDSDYGTSTWSPADERIEHWLRVYHAVARANGADADAGRHLHGWLRQAGFADLQMSGTTWTFPGYDSAASWASAWADRTTASNLAAKALEYGIASRAELDTIADGFRVVPRSRGVLQHRTRRSPRPEAVTSSAAPCCEMAGSVGRLS